MGRWSWLAGAVGCCVCWAANAAPSAQSAQSALTQFEASALAFETNTGQTDARVQFLARAPRYQAFLTGPDATVKLVGAERTSAVRVRWIGAARVAPGTGIAKMPGATHYIRGDGASPAAGIQRYGRVRYTGVYPGVDLLYYASQGRLEYDLVVAPGADPAGIRFAVEGARRTALDADGDLVAHTPAGELKLHRPVVYQQVNGERQAVAARYARDGSGAWRIALASYDRSRELVIDPVLSYGSYLGGNGSNSALAIAVDGAGNAYVAGFTTAADFPVVSAYRSTITGAADTDAFVTKFNIAGNALAYSTYLGAIPARKGSTNQRIAAIAVDAAGSAYVTGRTDSAAFPVTSGAYQAGVTGGGAFVTKLTPAGNALAYSTYVRNATTTSIALDAAGNAYLTGTANPSFATTTGALQRTAVSTTAFAASLNASGTGMRWATFLGGTGTDSGNGIAVDASGNAYVAGTTTSANFPVTAGAYQLAIAGKSDGFIAKLNASGSSLLYATFFGGAKDDSINAIAVDAGGAAYVTGETYSADLPFRNAFQPVKSGRNLVNSALGNAFVAKLLPDGDALAYGSFLGGEICRLCQSSFGLEQYAADAGLRIAIDAAGHAYVTGSARTYTFPLVNSLIANQGGDTQPQNSAFLAKIGKAGSTVLYNTLTSTDTDQNVFAVAVDAAGQAYGAGTSALPGQAGSIDLVAAGSYDSTPNGAMSALVFKLSSATPAMTLATSANPAAAGQTVTLTATVADTALTGTVLFYDGATVLGSAPLAQGSAAISTPLAAGIRRLVAVYRSPGTAADSALLHAVVNPALVCR